MADNRTIPVKKTGYRKRGKVKRTSQEQAQLKLDLFPKRQRLAKQDRYIGQQVQFHNPVYQLGFGLVANVGEFGTYFGEVQLAESPGDYCAIGTKSGYIVHLPDDGKTFRWIE